MFSYFSKYLPNKQSIVTDNYNVKIDILDENTNFQKFSNIIETFDFCDIEAGKTSVKTLFTNDEWEQISKSYYKSLNKQQFITQLFNEVNNRKKVLLQLDI